MKLALDDTRNVTVAKMIIIIIIIIIT